MAYYPGFNPPYAPTAAGQVPYQPYPPHPGHYPPVPPAYGTGNAPLDGTPLLNPATPYFGPLPTPVQDGLTIFIQGFIPAGASRFHINLTAGIGKNESVDTALHVNPRFEGVNTVVRNSFLNRRWGLEERNGPPMPLRQNQAFECIILVTRNHYKIAFNGQHYCEYGHRTPVESVTYLGIEGNVSLTSIRLQGPGVGAAVSPAGMAPPPYTPPMCVPPSAIPQSTISIPYKQPLPGGLKGGSMVQITGRVAYNPNQFTVNLSYYEDQGRNVALHFNPRFQDQVVVRNTLNGPNWGREERGGPPFPFKPRQNFEILILVQQDKYKVAVNNQHFMEYVHRLRNLSNIRYLFISGDIELTKVQVF